MQTEGVEKSFCTTTEAAQLLGVSVGTVQLWVETGLLHAWKTAGGHRRVMRQSVNSLLHRNPAVPSTALPAAPSQSLSVMVVEDDVTLLLLYKVKLASWPMAPKVAVVDNAFEALLRLGRNEPDLLITDLQMPGMDGFAMLRAIKATPSLSRTTVVAVSGLDASYIEAHGGIPAQIELLAKPIPFERLEAIAQSVLQSKRAQLGAAV